MKELVSEHPYRAIYSVLDEVAINSPLPAGARGTVYRAIDGLLRSNAPAEHIALAQKVSVAIHRLDWARLFGAAGEQEAIVVALRGLGEAWMQTPMGVLEH